MIDFKEVAIYLFGLTLMLGVYIWQQMNARIIKLEKGQFSILSEDKVDTKIATVKNDINLQLSTLANSLDKFMDKMEERHKRFENIEVKFEKFLDSRQDLHNHLTVLSSAVATKEEMIRTINILEQLNAKMA